MVRAIISRGGVQPVDPLPEDWLEGQALRIEKADERELSTAEIQRDFAVLASLCSNSEPAAEEQLERALTEARQTAKDQVRHSMGIE
jgi:hypothetical protein